MRILRERSNRPNALLLFVCCNILVTLSSLTTLSAGENQAETLQVSERYIRVLQDYKKKLATLQRQGAKGLSIIKLVEERDAAFARLVIENPLSKIEKLSVPALVALASCCEYLKRRDECLHYCQAVLDRDPDHERIYFPLVRTLLNLDRLEEARTNLAKAEARFPPTSPIRAMHFALYVKSQFEKQQAEAADHISQLIEYYFAYLKESPSTTRLATRRLEAFVDAHHAVGEASNAQMDLKRYRNLVVRQLETSHQKIVTSNLNESTISTHSALHHLLCELTRHVSPSKLSTAQSEWLVALLPLVAAHPSNKSASSEFISVLKYLSQHSYAWDETTKRAVREAISSMEAGTKKHENVEQISKYVSTLKLLERLMHQKILLSKLVGRTAPSLTELEWLREEESNRKTPIRRVLLLHFWNPLKSSGHRGLRAIGTLKEKYSEKDLEIVCVSNYAGFNWDAKKFKIERRNDQNPDAERTSLREILSIQKIDLPCALVQKKSDFAEFFKSDYYPLNVIIDQSGMVRFVEIGVQPPVLRYLDNQIKRLVKFPKPVDSARTHRKAQKKPSRHLNSRRCTQCPPRFRTEVVTIRV